MSRFLPIFYRRPQQYAYLPPAARQRGISVIAGIFLLLLMAGLAAFMANIISVTHLNMASDIGGSRAYQAARAGVEWGMYQLDPNGQSATLPDCVSGTITAIPGHTVDVVCSASADYQEGSRTVRIFRIVATAKAPGRLAIERVVAATIEKCRDTGITVAPYDC